MSIEKNTLKAFVNEQIEKGKTPEMMLKELLAQPAMKEMISAYQKAEKSWLSSAMSPTQEIENRLRLVNAYGSELKALYYALEKGSENRPELREAANKLLEDNGIKELVKDYQTFYDPKNKTTEFLYNDANDYEKKFRKNYDQVKTDIGDAFPQNEGLVEFHKYLLQNGDFGTGITSNVNNTSKAVRPFIDNFMALPEKEQMQALYSLENKLYKNNTKVTDEMLEGYKPDMKKITSVLKASNFKFWKRMNSSYIYWDKLKKCVDNVHDINHPKALSTGTKVKNALKKVGSKLAKVGTLLMKSPKPNAVLTKATAIVGSAKAFKKMADEAELTSGVQKADVVLGEAKKYLDAVKMTKITEFVKTKNFGAIQQFQGLAIAANAIGTVTSAMDLVASKKNVSKVANLDKEIKEIMKDKSLTSEQKDILKKLETNTRMLKVINRDKVKIARAETVKNSVALGSSAMMASGVGVAALIPQLVTTVGTKIYESKVRNQNTIDVIEAKMYESPEQKKEKIQQAKTLMVGRYVRLPEKLRNKYTDQVADIVASDKKIAGQLRQEEVRKSGQVNQLATKNSYVKGIGEDIYNLLKTGAKKAKDGVFNELDKKFIDLANKFIKATGGKDIDIRTIKIDSPQAQMQQEKTVNRLVENMKV